VAEDGTRREYTLSVRVPADPLGLSRFYFPKSLNPTLPGGDVDAFINGRMIHMVVPFGVSPTALHPLVEPQFNGAEILMDDQPWPEAGKVVDFSLFPVFSVKAPGLSRADMKTNIRVASSDSKDMLAFGYLQSLNPSLDQDYDMDIGGSVISSVDLLTPGVTTLIPTFTVTGVRLEGRTLPSGSWRTFISGSTGMDVRQDWEFRVTAFDGTSQIYTFAGGGAAIADWDSNEIVSFTFRSAYNRDFDADVNGVITPGLVDFDKTIPFMANVDGLFPSIQVSPGARISPLPTVLSFPDWDEDRDISEEESEYRTNRAMRFRVTAQSGATQEYIIGLEKADPSDERFIANLDLVGSTLAIPDPVVPATDGGTILIQLDVPLDSGVDPKRIFTNFTVPNTATVTPKPGYQDYRFPVLYTVQAQDGSRALYRIEVNFTNDTDAAITGFRVGTPSREGLISGNSIIVRVPSGMDTSSLAPEIAFVGSNVTPSSGSSIDFSGSQSTPIPFTVTGDPDSLTYYARVIPSTPSEKAVEGFWLMADDNPGMEDNIFASKAGQTLFLNLPRDIDPSNLVVRFSVAGERLVSGGSDLVSGVSTMDLSTNKTLTVIAEDNSTSLWTLITSIATDSVPPALTDSQIGVSLEGADGFTLTWEKATDQDDLGHVLNPALLAYKIVGIGPGADPFDQGDYSPSGGWASINSTGNDKYLFRNWTNNLSSFTVMGLSPSTEYDVVVFVRDLDQNMTHYPFVTASTTADPTKITAFSVPALGETGKISEFNRTIAIKLPQSADTTDIQPEITLAGLDSTVTPNSGESVDFSDGFEVYTVTGDDGSVGVYTAFASRQTTASNDLIFFFLPDLGVNGIGGAHDPSLGEINLYVPYDNSIAGYPDITGQRVEVLHTGASISPDVAGPVDFLYTDGVSDNPRVFRVLGEDGSFQDYTVRIRKDIAGTLQVNVTLSGIPSEPSFSFNPPSPSTTVVDSTNINVTGLVADYYQWYLDGVLLFQGPSASNVTLPAGLDPGIHDITLVVEIDGLWFSENLTLLVNGL
jgi:hypothetical protein